MRGQLDGQFPASCTVLRCRGMGEALGGVPYEVLRTKSRAVRSMLASDFRRIFHPIYPTIEVYMEANEPLLSY